jgi:arylsulfatase A-like enzyme
MRFLASFLLLSSALFAAQPNVLVIIADDLGYADIGVHGGAEVPTPHIDALAASGVRCTNGYVSAPYCSPSRAGFLTGKAATRFGHEFNPHVGDEAKLGLPLDQLTIANALHDAGYATALIGKWHQGFDAAHHPLSRGFNEYFGFLVGGHNFLLHKDAEPEFGSAHSHDMIYRGRDVQKLDGYTTELFTDEALSFMNRHSAKPWFLYLAYNAVHTPLEIAEKLKERVPASVTDPDRRGYLSLLSGLDDAIGRLMAEVKAKHPDTLVFFFSDNGGSGIKPFFAYNTGRNTPLRGDKGQTYEGGIRVPFFVSWPGKLPAGKTYDHPVTALDVLPTSCAVAGAKAPEGIEGVNLVPHLSGEKSEPPHDMLAWRFGPQQAIRKGSHKLVIARDMKAKKNSAWQLFDLSTDIGEQNDLAASKPELVSELKAAWEAWNSKNILP